MTTGQDLERHIAQLRKELEVAQRRADVAEEQLRRVHIAVREFKQRLLSSRQAQAAAAKATSRAGSSGLYREWPLLDPTLDDRFKDFLDGGEEDDRARKWILDES